jgi:hypothetical protein
MQRDVKNKINVEEVLCCCYGCVVVEVWRRKREGCFFFWKMMNSEEDEQWNVDFVFSSKPFNCHLTTCHTSGKETGKMEDKRTGGDLNSFKILNFLILLNANFYCKYLNMCP